MAGGVRLGGFVRFFFRDGARGRGRSSGNIRRRVGGGRVVLADFPEAARRNAALDRMAALPSEEAGEDAGVRPGTPQGRRRCGWWRPSFESSTFGRSRPGRPGEMPLSAAARRLG